jgi:hypothetical protein
MAEPLPTPEQRAKVERAMAALEAAADQWAEEIGLAQYIEMMAGMADKLPAPITPDAAAARAHFLGRLKNHINEWIIQGFIEGFDRGQEGRRQHERQQMAETLRLIQAQAGNPDPAEGCRVIIATAEAALLK